MRRWGDDGDDAGDGDDVGDDLDDARDEGDDLPFRKVFSPVESTRWKGIFFSVGFRHRAVAELTKLLPF